MNAVAKFSKTAVAVVCAVMDFIKTAVAVVHAVMEFIKTAVAVVHAVMDFIENRRQIGVRLKIVYTAAVAYSDSAAISKPEIALLLQFYLY